MASSNQKATWLPRKLFEIASELVPATPRRQLADGRWSKPSIASVLAEACEIGLAELQRRAEERQRTAASAALPPTLVDETAEYRRQFAEQDEARRTDAEDEPRG